VVLEIKSIINHLKKVFVQLIFCLFSPLDNKKRPADEQQAFAISLVKTYYRCSSELR
jgi:hypothetical protein